MQTDEYRIQLKKLLENVNAPKRIVVKIDGTDYTFYYKDLPNNVQEEIEKEYFDPTLKGFEMKMGRRVVWKMLQLADPESFPDTAYSKFPAYILQRIAEELSAKKQLDLANLLSGGSTQPKPSTSAD